MSSQKPFTKNQRLVFDVLKTSARPLSAYAILDRLRDEGLKAPLQIYRALDVLLMRGKVHRIESVNAYVACSSTRCKNGGATGFAICSRCGQSQEFSDREMQEKLQEWADGQGFVLNGSVVEINGICAGCAR